MSEWKTEIVVKLVKGEYKIYTKIRIKGDRPKTLWNRPEYSGTTGTNELKGLISYNEFSYPKAVQLVIDSLQIATEPDSIVLDFFGGSGTTGQAVMDLNAIDNGSRQFILVEQMDYINTVSVPRLEAVIKKHGKGSFVYCELAKLNQNFADRIINATDEAELKGILDDVLCTGFISYQVTPKDIDTEAEDYKSLCIDDKKRLLLELLDKNQLYINYCDMEDETFDVSDKDKTFTKSFYGEV